MKRVVVALSGGVDSSVAAHLLKKQGHEVIGMYMKNWHDQSVTLSSDCPWEQDSNDALVVAESLGIPFQTVDLSADYKTKIVDYMFQTYLKGKTPNPDVLCNREIKFDSFLKVTQDLDADFIATGHYCRKSTFQIDGENYYRLLRGRDRSKDQSYFLSQINQYQLSKVLFPIGDLFKHEVRAIAQNLGLITATKKDSQGLCFVGKVKLPDFLKQKLQPKIGQVIEIPSDSPLYNKPKKSWQAYNYNSTDGKVIGTHQGTYYFTIGQRKGLNIGGKTEPLFIIALDSIDNIIYVGEGSRHPGLYRCGLKIKQSNIHWLNPEASLGVNQNGNYTVSIRYRQEPQPATLSNLAGDLYILFDKPQKAIAAGQFAVWYQNEILIGSGVID